MVTDLRDVSKDFTGIAEYPNRDKYWYKEGKYHREDGPAIEYSSGGKEWYKEGFHHREDGPAVELADGTKYWYKEGKRHRIDGPAVERSDGTKYWCKEGACHREDGPAYEDADGTKFWYIHGKLMDTDNEIEIVNFLGIEKMFGFEWMRFQTEKKEIKRIPIVSKLKYALLISTKKEA